jgi:predicted HTH transcriptional regulator
MKNEELLSGENINIEYKRELPEKSLRYVKTVVAFANGNGGHIVFGVDDETREVVGMDNENIFKTIDAITAAISDSCEPAIVPNVALKTIDGKTIIIVEVEAQRGIRVNFYRLPDEISQAADKVKLIENQEVTIITDKVTDKVTDKDSDKVDDKVFHRFKSLIISINSENLERKEIMQRMGLNHISFFIDTYLTPAINQGYVAMLYPDKPRHPKQKYYLTEKGRELLKTLQTQS